MKTANYILTLFIAIVVFACKEHISQSIEKNTKSNSEISKENTNPEKANNEQNTNSQQNNIEQISNSEANFYVNERFNFALKYPSFLIAEEESDNGDGKRFVSEDGKFILLAYGSLNLSDNLKQDFDIATENDCYFEENYKITYKTFGGTWFVINGIFDKTMFYVYSILTDHAIVSLYFEYPLKEKEKYNEYVEQIVKNLNTNYEQLPI